jgi:hypothetical protein
MAEAQGAAGSIVGIVEVGLKLATTLQTYVESIRDAEERIRDVAVDVNSTASALRQLGEILEADKVAVVQKTTKVFKDEGRNEIEVLAEHCGKMYATITLLVTKAGSAGLHRKTAVKALSARPLAISSLGHDWKWSWLEPRIKRSQEQLRWLKLNLLFDLQLAGLARYQLR